MTMNDDDHTADDLTNADHTADGHASTIRSRRNFIAQCSAGGLLGAALATLGHWNLPPQTEPLESSGETGDELPAVNPLLPKDPHFTPRAKNVIFLYMAGAPSQLDLFDPKPALTKWHGRPFPESETKDLKLSFVTPHSKAWASSRIFEPCGESGMEISDWMPHLQTVADEICMVRSMHTDVFNHHPGQSLMMSGSPVFGRPTIGSWVTYGLGSECQNLPGFVVLSSGKGTEAGTNNWSNGFLPSTYRGTSFFNSRTPILYVRRPKGIGKDTQGLAITALREMNKERFLATGDREIASRVSAYELAFRMQSSAPELTDYSGETKEVLDTYGIGSEPTNAFGSNCLLARRMVEKGVRFVMLAHASWDSHAYLEAGHGALCHATDQPVAALIRDLKRRGLLEDTLVVWGGEFGRTPMAEVRRPSEAHSFGRDHLPNAFTVWLAGGGIKAGHVLGATDELGLQVVSNPVHVHDLQATILHCLGLNHTRLTHRHLGRDFRLTDVGGHVIQDMLA